MEIHLYLQVTPHHYLQVNIYLPKCLQRIASSVVESATAASSVLNNYKNKSSMKKKKAGPIQLYTKEPRNKIRI